MAWHGVVGHDEVVERFRRALGRGRLASSYLFVGPPGVGKRLFADRLAQSLLCSGPGADRLEPCHTCRSCQLVAAGTHPDLETVSLPVGKRDIPIELLIGDREHRSRAGFCYALALKPFMGGRKVGIIDDADLLNEEGANCLLKTLEEPPRRSVLILIGTAAERQLPTIRSRCQQIRFQPLSCDDLGGLLVQQEIATDRTVARQLARYGQGSVHRAAQWAQDDLLAFREQFLRQLAELRFQAPRTARAVGTFVESVGKDPPLRRARAMLAVETAIEFFGVLLHGQTGGALSGETDRAVDRPVAIGEPPVDATSSARCLQRCVLAQEQIRRNANVSLLVECWLVDLADLIRSS